MTTAKNPNLHTKLPADMVAAIGKGIGVWADIWGHYPVQD